MGTEMSVTEQAAVRPAASAWLRWGQLVVGVICMVMIANLQYGWTFFVPGIQKTFGWDRASIQVAFTLFVLFETWLVPIEGWFVDRYGPQVVVFVGGRQARREQHAVVPTPLVGLEFLPPFRIVFVDPGRRAIVRTGMRA